MKKYFNVMSINLLLPFLFVWTGGPQVPNYFRSYPTASAEASRIGKEMIIFFSSQDCTNCEGAWMAYTKDAKAVNRFISTKVMADDFDGQILYEQFNPGQAPSWVVLGPNGQVKEKWNGGWKDASGNPTLFENVPVIISTPKPEKTITTSTSKSQNTQAVKNETIVASTKSTPTPTAVASANTTEISSGLIIQAGYFGSEANAQKCVSDVKSKGFNHFSIKPIEKNGSMYYQVWSKSFKTESEAQVELQKMTSAGLKGTVKTAS